MKNIKDKNQDLVKKTFNLTSIFADIKSEHSWTTIEVKTVLLVLEKISKYTIYLPNFDENIQQDEIDKAIKEIPLIYEISTDLFKEITGVRSDNLAREIKKVSKGLLSKVIMTSHPLESKNNKSFVGFTWFTKVEYSNNTGKILLKLNSDAVDVLVAFVKYSKVSFEYITKLKNNYSIHTYLTLKILKDASYKEKVVLDVEEYKEKLGIKHKYKNIFELKTRVLEVIKLEINEHTDIKIDYELIKEGRAFTKIKFTFDYKLECLEQKNKPNRKIQVVNSLMFNDEFASSDSPFEAILVGWGIRAKKVVEIEESYSLDVIQSAIDLTLEKEAAGEIKTTKAAIFLGILENRQLVSDEIFEREQQEIAKQQEKEYQKQLAVEYEAIEKFINDNSDEISNYLSIRSGGGSFELSSSVKEELSNLACVDAEKFKDFRPKLPVLHEGYFDIKQRKEVRPNMYTFLTLIGFVS
ncbi:replication initiation protein [Allofrancisella guangzhouensis]|uniref:replication initiation protein n=1 Tax=Allofrancisella guangzhouensis TaxID=594679 RepID=UPI001906D1C7|nr:replication initiation protein [Allofrancisella guangzhouensis]MBK2043675.1 replication initiation protein [Allofrancisella guangzhouensis]